MGLTARQQLAGMIAGGMCANYEEMRARAKDERVATFELVAEIALDIADEILEHTKAEMYGEEPVEVAV